MKAHLKQAGRIKTCDEGFWRLEGPQLRERPEEQPRARLPAEPAVRPPCCFQLVPAMAKPQAAFFLGRAMCYQVKLEMWGLVRPVPQAMCGLPGPV
eukprot:1241019-Amphidinium_carterae.1